MTKVYAEVYGCPSNIADYEISLGLLNKAGFEFVDSPKESDINIIFTCVVKEPTSKRMEYVIGNMVKLDTPLLVAGCMPRIYQDKINMLAPDASMLGPDSIEKVVDVVNMVLDGERVIFIENLRKSKMEFDRLRKYDDVGIIPISIGCNQKCTYCCVKFARGELYCYPPEDVIDDVKTAVNDGCDEIWITSQDNASYNYDGIRLPEFLGMVCEVPGDFIIRVGMMNPTYLKDDKMLDNLLHVYNNKKIKKFLHIPVQSGSNSVLKSMKRGYSVGDFKNIVKRFRKEIPDIFLSTDIIVGFPTETEDDFRKTIELITEIKPDNVNVSKFGPRPGTKSEEMNQLGEDIINRRSRDLYHVISSL